MRWETRTCEKKKRKKKKTKQKQTITITKNTKQNKQTNKHRHQNKIKKYQDFSIIKFASQSHDCDLNPLWVWVEIYLYKSLI